MVSGLPLSQRFLAALDRRGEAVAVTLVGEIALELRDEQAAVREDQTPRERAASTKPAAAIVLPDAVGWRNR